MTDLEIIQEFSAAGRHQECLQTCQNYLQANQEEAYAYKYAGKSLLALGQLEKAQQCLVKAHQLDGSDPEIAKDIGNIFLNHGNTGTALGWYETALEIKIDYAPAISNIANLKRLSGKTQEAIDLFKRAIQADPKLIQAYIGAATSFLALADLDQAKSFAKKALEINSNTPGVNETLGIIYQNERNPSQAIEYYKKEVEINPKAYISLLNSGLLLLQNGQAEAALELLVKASALAPSEQCSLLLAQVYQNLGQFKEAINEYQKLDISQSKDKSIPFNLGLCLLNTGHNNAAIEKFKIAIQLDETYIPALGNIGTAFKREGRNLEAIQATQKVLDLDPDNTDAHINLGAIYQDIGQLNDALAYTLKSIQLNTDNPTAHMNLGGIYKDLGQLDHALASTLKALELKPDNPIAHMNLGGIYQDLGQLDNALVSTLKALELKPDNPTAHMHLGKIYKDVGKASLAITYLKKAIKSEETKEEAVIELSQLYHNMGSYIDGVSLLSEFHDINKKAKNLMLSLYLCLNEKAKFKQCAEKLRGKHMLNQQGIAAIDHANILYNQCLDNGLEGSTLDSVFTQAIDEQEFSDKSIREILSYLSSESLQSKHQSLLINGFQTSGNILEIPKKPFQKLKALLIEKIDNYNQSCNINTDKHFRANWEKNLYILRGWAIIMDKGGSLKPHNHELGWLTGTLYLQIPDKVTSPDEGAIEFSHQGPKYPIGSSIFEKKVIRPKTKDLNIFSSSLFHRTLPFQAETQRICIAFDVTRNESNKDPTTRI